MLYYVKTVTEVLSKHVLLCVYVSYNYKDYTNEVMFYIYNYGLTQGRLILYKVKYYCNNASSIKPISHG